jgi:hypothetical protein
MRELQPAKPFPSSATIDRRRWNERKLPLSLRRPGCTADNFSNGAGTPSQAASQEGGFRTHGCRHAELKVLADLPKVREDSLEMSNGLIVFVESTQDVAFKGDDTSTTLARQ